MAAHPISLRVGQQWRARDGSSVAVTFDRGEEVTWRWALSNSQIADELGRVAMDGRPDPNDLVKLIRETP